MIYGYGKECSTSGGSLCDANDLNVFGVLGDGFITKGEYAFTFREHQAACDEMKSKARETGWRARECC